ncbi:hypothetical protein J2Z44_000844 [Clostridium punense]|uniref:Uncharacterized protein n=1 Tax=Clostridium punense TaxID=1054297 RepID=A0ABS4JZU5_9CLOT|nr:MULTISPECIES: hypothetical protein [Clostridium]EQB89279.1 hypothetical protein M918_20760 [Clostridium sp. BL8]MBP2021057.1 hypothetical protein [Clostridium punense]
MKRIFYSLIVVTYSVICIYIMTNYNVPNKNINHNITVVKKQQGEVQMNGKTIEDKEIKGNNEKEDQSVSSYTISNPNEDSEDEINFHDYRKRKSIDMIRDSMEELSQMENVDEIKGEFDAYNIEQRKRNQVIKVPIEDLVSYLSLEEKAKILSLSKKLTKEDFQKFQEYLSYKNQKIGVRRALEILEQRMSSKQVSEIKEIFSKYIDMNTVENIKS